MSYNTRTNVYRSSNSVIISSPGTMYNEITRLKQYTKNYNDKTNEHDVTAQPIKVRKMTNSNNNKSKSKSINNSKSMFKK